MSSTEAFSSIWLAEQLQEFKALYPGICIELVADNQLTDLHTRGADIAIRLLQPTQQDLVARRVGTLRLGIGPLYRSVGDNEINLVRVPAGEPEIEMDIWLTALPDLKEYVRVRALYDCLASPFVQQKHQFA